MIPKLMRYVYGKKSNLNKMPSTMPCQEHFLPAFPKDRMKLLQKNPSQR